MRRTKHSLSHYKLATLDMGKLIPVGLLEALPGDTFQGSTSLLIRVSPLLAPVMHPISVRVHHWFVPHRLVWDDWDDFITGGTDGLGDGAVYPAFGPEVVAKGSLLEYLGVPPATYLIGQLSKLPAMGYNLIYNEYYRDQDLIPPVVTDSKILQPVAWEKDYFTTCRPWTQKGPQVVVPLGTAAPVKTSSAVQVSGAQQAMRMTEQDGGPGTNLRSVGVGNYGGDSTAPLVPSTTAITQDAGASLYPANLYADLTSAASAAVNDVRRAFALQRYQEARAMYGSRYTEYLRYIGVASADSRLQRPEYLGGGKQTIAFSEVLRTGSGDAGAEPVGTLKGHGIAAVRSNRYRYFCQEHGYVFTMLSVRPKTMYVQGLERTWSKRTKEDYWQRELEMIGQQEVFNRELFVAGAAADDNVFGYQDRYAEYRHQRSSVSGDFRDTLNFWHMARSFAALPTLNSSFVQCDPTTRIFASTSTDPLWSMISHSVQVRRMVGNVRVGRVL